MTIDARRIALLKAMPSLARALTGVQASLARPLAAAQAMKPRERIALAAVPLALLLVFDLIVVMGMHDKRRAIESALQAAAHGLAAARTAEEQLVVDREAELELRTSKVTTALAGFGVLATQRESLHFLLRRTLQGLPVTVVGLRAAGSSELDASAGQRPGTGAAGEAPSARTTTPAQATVVTPAESNGTALATAPGVSAQLYRHRYELELGGTLQALLATLETLETDIRPLRVERVRLAGDASGALRASVTLMTLGPKRTWLTL